MPFNQTKIYKICEKIERINEGQVFKTVLDNEVIKNLVIELNTQKQLKQESVDSLGQELFNQFTGRNFYAANDPLGRGGEPYQVRRTGDFYKSFRVEITNDAILIFANPNKRDTNLFEMYSPEIVGLTEESKDILRGKVRELYQQWLREYVRV